MVQHFGLGGDRTGFQAVRALLKMTGRKLGVAEELALAVVGAFFVRAGLGETARLVLIGELAGHKPQQLAVDAVAIFDGRFATVTRREGSQSWDLATGEEIPDPVRGGHRQLMTSVFHIGNYYAEVRRVLGA